MWQKAFSTLGCPELALDAVFALATRHRLDAVELRALCGTVELPVLFADRFGTPGDFARAVEAQPVRIAAFGTSVRLLDAGVEDRAALLEYVPWAEAGRVAHLRVFDGGEQADAAERARARDLLAWWRAERAAHGWAVDLIVETHDALANAATLTRFVEDFPETSLLWDTHHTWRKGGQGPADTWSILRRNTRHIHVKDSVSRPSARLPYSYTLPGQGEFPMPALRRVLQAEGYAGVLSLEWERMWHPALPPLDEALAAAAAASWL